MLLKTIIASSFLILLGLLENPNAISKPILLWNRLDKMKDDNTKVMALFDKALIIGL